MTGDKAPICPISPWSLYDFQGGLRPHAEGVFEHLIRGNQGACDMVSHAQNLQFGPTSLNFLELLYSLWLFDKKYLLFMPKLKICRFFCQITIPYDRNKLALSNGMLLVSGK